MTGPHQRVVFIPWSLLALVGVAVLLLARLLVHLGAQLLVALLVGGLLLLLGLLLLRVLLGYPRVVDLLLVVVHHELGEAVAVLPVEAEDDAGQLVVLLEVGDEGRELLVDVPGRRGVRRWRNQFFLNT